MGKCATRKYKGTTRKHKGTTRKHKGTTRKHKGTTRKHKKKYIKKGKTLYYFKGGDKELDRLNKINDQAYKEYFDCKDKYCGDIRKKIDAILDTGEYSKQLNKKCPEIEGFDDLQCKKTKCKNHMKCINDFYKKSKYGKLSEQMKKCAIKKCSIKEKEMNEAFNNANNYNDDNNGNFLNRISKKIKGIYN